MICPYCLDDVANDAERHEECRIVKDRAFPRFYIDFHGGDGAAEPVIFSVVGFSGHGKTVYLCALFDFLDNQMTEVWPGFYNHVLDQDSLSRLVANRKILNQGILPDRTGPSFPRPGIFRLRKMAQAQDDGKFLKDTTMLIYDPAGEAFETEDKIVELAGFVRRSKCVLFLIDINALRDSIADGMARLLDTYVLGMRRMGIEQRSQHLIVVYTKSDEMRASLPEFQCYLSKEPTLNAHLNEQISKTLLNPFEHLNELERISHSLAGFTRSELRAGRFIHEADDWFATVSYTAVSSLGFAPEDSESARKLTAKMSPRCVADPLLLVLAKSLREERSPTPEQPAVAPEDPRWKLKAAIFSVLALALIILVIVLWLSTTSERKPAVLPKASDAPPTLPAQQSEGRLNQEPDTRPSDPPDDTSSKAPAAVATLLRVHSNVESVLLSVDGVSRGYVSPGRPTQIRVSRGTHFLEATKAGYKPWASPVQLAIGTKTVVIELEPVGPSPQEMATRYLEKANALVDQRQYDAAIQACSDGLRLDPSNPLLLQRKADIERAREAYAAARRNEEERERAAAARQPSDSEAAQEPFHSAVVTRRVTPSYPDLARSARVSGRVTVRVQIDEGGNVSSASVVEGPALLRDAAIRAARQWRYSPARRGNRAVKDAQLITFNFTLD